MTTNKPQWQEATDVVAAAETILVVTHVSPDGDAIGSLLGLSLALKDMGKTVTSVVDGGVSTVYTFLPAAASVLDTLDSGSWDLMISVDASDEARIGQTGAYGMAHSPTVINLDHHPTNTYFGDIYLVVPDAVSATEVIFEWLKFMKITLVYDVALPLLTGLVTDTLGFRTSNVTANTLRIAQELMETGASLSEVTARALDSKAYNVVALWKRALPSAKLDGQIISANVTQANLKDVGMSDIADGGLVNFLIKVNEAMIAVVFKETPDGKVELSLRCKPGYDVAQVAFGLGGGGHKQASGATIDGPLEAARKRVMPLLKEAAKQGKLQIG